MKKRIFLNFYLLLFSVIFSGFVNFTYINNANADGVVEGSTTNTKDLANNDVVKDNGIVVALCYFLDLITGTFARAIMALYVVLLGMSLLSGKSEAASPATFISITIAICFIFGSGSLANLIFNNVTTCKALGL